MPRMQLGLSGLGEAAKAAPFVPIAIPKIIDDGAKVPASAQALYKALLAEEKDFAGAIETTNKNKQDGSAQLRKMQDLAKMKEWIVIFNNKEMEALMRKTKLKELYNALLKSQEYYQKNGLKFPTLDSTLIKIKTPMEALTPTVTAAPGTTTPTPGKTINVPDVDDGSTEIVDTGEEKKPSFLLKALPIAIPILAFMFK